jgi:hypothetical protein
LADQQVDLEREMTIFIARSGAGENFVFVNFYQAAFGAGAGNGNRRIAKALAARGRSYNTSGFGRRTGHGTSQADGSILRWWWIATNSVGGVYH